MSEHWDWLVQTKLQPPLLHADTIERQRPLAALHAAVTTRPVTLVSAPAGYGKTTLVASLSRLAPELRMAWLTLDSDDNDVARFLSALTASLQRLHGAVGVAAFRDAALDPRRVLSLLINDLIQHLTSPFVLVLDDLHMVTEPRVHTAIDYLIERMPPQMRLVIVTRHDPPLALARLIARRQLAEVRRPHLNFTAEEVRLLLNDTLGLQLDADTLAALTARTEGWAAGLCLLASSFERITTEAGRADFLHSLTHTDRYVFDFLAAEVLNHQEPSTRSFLLQTSILTELTPAACAAVTGRSDTEQVLADLYRRNLFLVADEAGTYRYHALFADFLLTQLAQEYPQMLRELHQRAAAAQSSPSRAVFHLLEAGQFDDVATVIEQVGERYLLMGLSGTLRNWGRQLPEEVRGRHPFALYLIGRALISLGEYRFAYMLMEQARKGFADAQNATRQAETIDAMCSCTILTGDVATCADLAEQFFALPHLPDTLLARGLSTRVHLYAQARQWDEAGRALQDALALTSAANDLTTTATVAYRLNPWAALLPGCLEPLERFCRWSESALTTDLPSLRLALADFRAVTALLRGHLDVATDAARAGLALRHQIDGYPWLGLPSAMCMATVAAARGDHTTAATSVELLQRLAGNLSFVQAGFWHYVAARTAWLSGSTAPVSALLDRMENPTVLKSPLMWPVQQRRLTGLRLLGERRPAEAAVVFREAAALEQTAPVTMLGGSSRVLLIRALLDQQRTSEALAELRELLRICQELEMPGLLLQEGALIQPLLRQWANRPEWGSDLAATVVSLLDGSTGSPPPVPGSSDAATLPEPLTDRELDVLRFLASGASNHEIAAALIIGDETVKTHVARILRKLDTPTRAQAAARGRQLGLIK